jgi:hypothetical protein
MENDPGISGVVFLSASAAKDKDKHFPLHELQKSRPRACTAAGPTQSGAPNGTNWPFALEAATLRR